MAKIQTKEQTAPTTNEEKLNELREFIAAARTRENPHSHLISVLHRTQELFGYLPTEVMDEIAQIKQQMPDVFDTFMGYYEKTRTGERDLYF